MAFEARTGAAVRDRSLTLVTSVGDRWATYRLIDSGHFGK
jgi:hypothetical protein